MVEDFEIRRVQAYSGEKSNHCSAKDLFGEAHDREG
jgi:hypothetical protein